MLIAQISTEIQSWLAPLGTFMGGLAALLLASVKIISTLRLSKTRKIDTEQTQTSVDSYIDFTAKQIETWWTIQFNSIIGALFLMLVGPMAAHPIHSKSDMQQNITMGFTFSGVAFLVWVTVFCKSQIKKNYEERELSLTKR